MDPFTQGVVGSLFAQAGARRSQARPAAVVGLAAGMSPDLDVLIRSPNDSLLAIEFHRHFTHSLAMVPALALAVSLVVWWPLSRWRPDLKFARVYLWSLLAVASHGVLDAMTSYGTRLYWPLSDQRVAWNVISVIDPLFTAPLAVLLGIGVAVGSRKLMRIAAIWGAFYLAIGAVQQHRAEAITMHWAESNGLSVERVLAKPSFANLVLWRGLVDDGDSFHPLAIRILPGTQALLWTGASVPRFTDGQWSEDSRLSRDLLRFRHFSDDWLFRYDPYGTEGGIFIGDFRYAIDPVSARPLWGIRIDPDQPDRRAAFERPARVTEDERDAFFSRLGGRDPPP